MQQWAQRHASADARDGARSTPLRRTGRLTKSTIAEKLKADSLPDERFVELFVAACAAWAKANAIRLPDRLADEQYWLGQLERVLLTVENARDNARRSADASEKLRRLAIPHHLPPTSPYFVARDHELAMLDHVPQGTTDSPGSVPIVVISGAAGSGKSNLALRWAHAVSEHFPDGQLYLNLRHTDGAALRPEEAVRALLEALGEEVPPEYDAQVSRYRTVLARQRVMIVLDNAASADQVRSVLPAGRGCFVVVTSRHALDSLVAVEGAHPLSLAPFTPDQAWDLLTLRVGTSVVLAEPSATTQVVEFCAGLPLALNIVAALAISQADRSLGQVAYALADPGRRLTILDLGDDASNVRTIFRLSYAHLDPTTARLFRLLGAHAGPTVTTAAAASLAGVAIEDADRVLVELASQHLLEERQSGQYGFHDLLRQYAAELAETAETAADRHAAVRRVLDHYLQGAYAASMLWDPLRDPLPLVNAGQGVVHDEILDAAEALAWLRRQYPALLRAVHLAHDLGFDVHAWQLAWTMADFRLSRHRCGCDLAMRTVEGLVERGFRDTP